MILDRPAQTLTRAGVEQIIVAAVLAAYISFASGWRGLLNLELAAYFLASGVALIVYGSSGRNLPFKKLAATWLPIDTLFLAVFLVLFGAGLAVAESGPDGVGLPLMAAGYLALGVRTALRFFGLDNRGSGKSP